MLFSDYRGLKKRITAIRNAQEVPSSSSDQIPLHHAEDEDYSASKAPSDDSASYVAENSPAPPPKAALSSIERRDEHHPASIPSLQSTGGPSMNNDPPYIGAGNDEQGGIRFQGDASGHESTVGAQGKGRPGEMIRSTTINMGALPKLRRRATGLSSILPAIRTQNNVSGSMSSASSVRSKLIGMRERDPKPVIPLRDLIPVLTPLHKAFFEKLDQELEKVESFYCDREKEMRQKYVIV